jgi:hypothetical protein
MSFKRFAVMTATALALSSTVAGAQVGGGSVGGSGTVGGGGSVGGATIGGGTSGNAGRASPGNQSPRPGSPVLPNSADGVTSSGQINRSPNAANTTGNANGTANGSATTGTGGIDRTPAPAVTPPQSIIDQPKTPNIPAPNEPNSDPAQLNLQNGRSGAASTPQ